MSKCVVDMVREYLTANGYDGLYSPNECACKLDDLEPCGEMQNDCEAGYLAPCNCGEHDWHIVGTKGEQEEHNADMKEAIPAEVER